MNTFFSFIDKLNLEPTQKAVLEKEIWQQYGHDKAIFALDMSGFSLTVRRDGIVAYLAKIRKMQQLAIPLVNANQGEVVKCVADNLMAVFDDANCAVMAAIAIRQSCQELGQPVSIGLDYGRILLIQKQDCFGDAVNKAYKLGEDIARANEILITEQLQTQLPANVPYTLTAEHISISGLDFTAYKV